VDSSDRSPVLSAVPLERIEADTGQPREDFPRPELEALADSVEALGLVHPLVVERLGADRYRLIAGERRLRALRIGREQLLEREKEHTRLGDELARERRDLPWVPVDKEYVREGGRVNLQHGATLDR